MSRISTKDWRKSGCGRDLSPHTAALKSSSPVEGAQEKTGPLRARLQSCRPRPAITFQRGTAGCIAIVTWEEQRPCAYSATEVCASSRVRTTRMAACQPCSDAQFNFLEIPL